MSSLFVNTYICRFFVTVVDVVLFIVPFEFFKYGDLTIGYEGLKYIWPTSIVLHLLYVTRSLGFANPSGGLINTHSKYPWESFFLKTYFYYIQDIIRIRQQALPI